MKTEFDAFEYCADGALAPVRMRFEGEEASGWHVFRNDKVALELGPGYRLMRSVACGVCSTDLARRFLPFPLPQVTGHEVVAVDEGGARYAVDINASHRARGVETDCPFCAGGLSNHCPERLVLGIHDLPGGFGEYFLAAIGALRPLPQEMPIDNAVLVEPLAAALHGVRSLQLQDGDRIAVLGPRKLGMLAIASLAAERRRRDASWRISALARRPELLSLAESLGADESIDVSGGNLDQRFDVVIDCSGAPAGFDLALDIADREVHLKSTNGLPAGGVEHLTEFVVDELNAGKFTREAFAAAAPNTVGWLASETPPEWVTETARVITADSAAELAQRLSAEPPDGLPKTDVVVVDSKTDFVEAIRPPGMGEYSPVRPTGTILLSGEDYGEKLLRRIARDGLRLSSTRCGDFSEAIELLQSEPELRGLGAAMITHRFGAGETSAAFAAAAGKDCIKAVVVHAS